MLVPKEKHGFVQRYYEDASSVTGYSMELLMTDDSRKTVPVSPAYWEVLHSEEYVFPLVQENMVVPVFDENGIMIADIKPKEESGYHGAYRFGCPKGFGYLMRVEGGKIVIDGKKFNDLLDNNLIAHYGTYRRGSFREIPRADFALEMTDDIAIYCLDFYGGDRCQKKRSQWYLNDVLKNNKNCYWLNLFDFWNGEGKVDQVIMFRHPPKDDKATGGNLSQASITNQQRFESASGSHYEDEAWYAE